MQNAWMRFTLKWLEMPPSFLLAHLTLQKGGDAAELAAKKKDMEAKRAANASRGVKTFYKVTVTV